MKHREHFPTFFDLMLEEMDRHHYEKGDSWLQDEISVMGYGDVPTDHGLGILLFRAISKYRSTKKPDQLEDIANLCGMIRLRGLLKDETNT